MNRQDLTNQSEAYIRKLLKERIPSQARVYLYGSRSRRDNRWNSDYDLWIDDDISRKVIAEIVEQLDESFVPFKVDIVATRQLNGRFAERVKQEAIYDAETFNNILGRLPGYAALFERVSAQLTKESN